MSDVKSLKDTLKIEKLWGLIEEFGVRCPLRESEPWFFVMGRFNDSGILGLISSKMILL